MNTVNGWMFAGGSGTLATEETNTTLTVHLDQRESNAKGASFIVDASRSSPIYQSGLNEVRVNALFGMNLIRAF